jgi:release factor glutamine methyltransferase
MTVLEILNWATRHLGDHQIENPRLNAELLLARSLNFSREGLYIRLNSRIGEGEKETFEKLVKRRVWGEPLQYILEHQEFWSLDLKVDHRVLIPRPETELLVEQALFILSRTSFEKAPSVLEIGTGSGAIAISLAKELKEIFLVATDISLNALFLAKENAKSAGVLSRIEFVNGDLWDPFRLFNEKGPFDMVLSNPPYIPRPDIDLLAREVKDHEPKIALDGGEEGMEFYRRIASRASRYFRKGGWLLLEVGQGQGEKVSELIEREGSFLKPEIVPDLAGIGRVVKAQRKPEGGT